MAEAAKVKVKVPKDAQSMLQMKKYKYNWIPRQGAPLLFCARWFKVVLSLRTGTECACVILYPEDGGNLIYPCEMDL